MIQENGYPKYLGLYTTVLEAFLAYKKEKESYINAKAKWYFDRHLITEKVYNALCNYKVKITD
jgi:hypothetical protein